MTATSHEVELCLEIGGKERFEGPGGVARQRVDVSMSGETWL